jgi:uncharacterized membrane-anchored protein YjiN (DUF445 family)
LSAIEETGLRRFLTQCVIEQLEVLGLAPFAANLRAALVEDDRHPRIFGEILTGLNRLLGSADAVWGSVRSFAQKLEGDMALESQSLIEMLKKFGFDLGPPKMDVERLMEVQQEPEAKMSANIDVLPPDALLKDWFSFDPGDSERIQDRFANFIGRAVRRPDE